MRFDKSKLKTQLAEVTTVNDVLIACYGNQAECARLLGVNRGSLRMWLSTGKDVRFIVERSEGQVKFIRAA